MLKTIVKKSKTLLGLDLAWAHRYYKKRAKMYFLYYRSRLRGLEYLEMVVDGLRLKFSFLHPYHHLFAWNLHKGIHETNELIMWKKKAAEQTSGVILDLGGYNGVFGLLAAAANPRVEVYIVEPDPINMAHIKKNIDINHLKNAFAIEAAVSDTDGTVSFTRSDGGTSGVISKSEDTYQVQCMSIDAWCERNKKRPVLIKCDIEGAEYRALLGMRRLLQESYELNILFELHYNFLKRFGDTKEDIWKLFKEYNYQTLWLDKDEFNEHYWIFRQSNSLK